MNARSALGFAASLLALLAAPALALNDGDLDTSFGTSGQRLIDLSTDSSDQVTSPAIAVAPDGSIALSFTRYDNSAVNPDMGLCPLSAAGVLSTCPIYATIPFGLGEANRARGVAAQLDGRLVVAGYTTVAADSATEAAFLGLDATGALDTGFGGGDGAQTFHVTSDSEVADVAARRNGDVAFVGYYLHEDTNAGTGYDCLVGRIHDTGSPDLGFDANGLQDLGWDFGAQNNDRCSSIALFPDGDEAVAGFAQESDGTYDFGVARLTSAGALDGSFSGDGLRVVAFDAGGDDADRATQVAIDPRERVVVAGTVDTGGGAEVGVARILPSGLDDTSFDGDGKLTFTVGDGVLSVGGLAVLPPPSHDIAVSGAYHDSGSGENHAFVKVLHDDGTPDTSFGTSGLKTFTITGAVANLSDAVLAVQGGDLVVGGTFTPSSADQRKAWVARLYRHAIFGDDFESGDERLWSNFADP